MTTICFTASPRGQEEKLAKVTHSWDMVEVVFAPALGNARYYQRRMKYSEEAVYAEEHLAMVAAAAAVADTRAERNDIQGVAGAMLVALEEDSLVPATEVRGVEAGES